MVLGGFIQRIFGFISPLSNTVTSKSIKLSLLMVNSDSVV